MVQLRRGGDDSLLEAVLREKLERQVKAGARRKELAEVRKRRRRNDKDVPLLELVAQERATQDGRDGTALAALKKFLAARRSAALSGDEDDQFRRLLTQTKAKLGSNAVKLAEEYVLRSRLEAERLAAGRSSVQERLSFVKMEYFLYALTDADRLMRQLERLGAATYEVRAEIDAAHREELVLREKLARS